MPRAAPQIDHLRAQVLRSQDVERAERLVHAQHFGLRDERPRETDALAHAARQLLRIGILVAGQADELERPLDLLLCLPSVEATLDEADLHVLLHREPWIEGEALKHDRETTIDAVERRPVTQDGALRRLGQARHQPQDRGLAGTRLSQQRQHLAVPHLEVDVVEHGHRRSAVGTLVRLRYVLAARSAGQRQTPFRAEARKRVDRQQRFRQPWSLRRSGLDAAPSSSRRSHRARQSSLNLRSARS